jgi:hypothetical protein
MLKRFYKKGDGAMLLGIASLWGFTELSGYMHQPWLFGVGVLLLVIGGLSYTLHGGEDDSNA